MASGGEAAAQGQPGSAEADSPAPSSLLERLCADRPGLPVCLITGFLGAGKTTLVNHILANSQGVRAAVFVNEYGSVDVDGALIRSQVDEDRVISLSNGCVCCEVNEDLARQLSRLLQERRDSIDVVIIETSGICDPEPVLATLQQVEDVDQVHLDTVICVVDATTLDDPEFGGSPDARRQLAHADVVLLNKVDLLADAAAIAEAEKSLHAYCEERGFRPVILRTERAEMDLAALCGLSIGSLGPPRKRRCPEIARPRGQHAQFTTFTFRATRPFDMLKFERWAASPPEGVLRAKGLLWVQGIPKYVCFHLAGRRTNPFETLPAREPPGGSEIVFVCRGAAAAEPEGIKRALGQCLC